jgi:Mobilization protein NikA
MARYNKTYDGERRTRRRVILLTPTEDQQLEESAEKAGTQFSEHVRELCLRRSAAAAIVAGTKRNPQTRDLLRELTAIGNNLNQLTKRAHATGQLPLRIELDHTTRLLKEAFRRVLEL